jgi:hypothetical protein
MPASSLRRDALPTDWYRIAVRAPLCVHRYLRNGRLGPGTNGTPSVYM